jgi:hypothetical protein
MPDQLRRAAIATLVALVALPVAHWFDAGWLADAQVRAGRTYEMSPYVDMTVVAHLLTAGAVVAVVWAAWWARSSVVAFGYMIVGGFIATLPALVWTFAVRINDAPARLPDPIASTMTHWWFTLEAGVTGAVYTIAAAMLIVGLAVLGSKRRAGRSRSVPAPAPASTSTSTNV